MDSQTGVWPRGAPGSPGAGAGSSRADPASFLLHPSASRAAPETPGGPGAPVPASPPRALSYRLAPRRLYETRAAAPGAAGLGTRPRAECRGPGRLRGRESSGCSPVRFLVGRTLSPVQGIAREGRPGPGYGSHVPAVDPGSGPFLPRLGPRGREATQRAGRRDRDAQVAAPAWGPAEDGLQASFWRRRGTD